MRGTIIKLKRTSPGAPEQWEGVLDTGQKVYARERHGEVRVELDGVTVAEKTADDPFAVLAEMFTIATGAVE